MKQTLFVRLNPDGTQFPALLGTMRHFNDACNHIASVAYELRTVNKVKLQREVYREVRDRFGLSAQMAIRAIGKVCEAYKRDRSKKPTFKPYGAMVYDQRILSWKRLEYASILTLKGRLKIPIRVGEYQKARIDRIRGQADLTLRNHKFYLAATIDAPEANQYDALGVLGVDLGIVNLAVDSDGATYKGETVQRVMVRSERIKRTLQRCGSRRARIHLKKLRGREARHRRNVNHLISKRLVAKAKDTQRMIGLENLEGVRNGTTVRRTQRRRHNSWGFRQLQQFIEYKAKIAGVPVVLVEPRGTSHICPTCGFQAKENRPTRNQFKCVSCGFAGPADHIAAVNIAARAAVNLPIVTPTLTGSYKPTNLFVGS